MSIHRKIKRYILEVQKISSNHFPSLQEIIAHLSEHDFQISRRTIQRDFEQIRFEFGIEIKYDRIADGYYIDYDNSLDTESFFRFLEIVNIAKPFSESSADSLKQLSFDNSEKIHGVECLKPLLEGIRDNREVSFIHTNTETGTSEKCLFKPYLLKEHQHRWYVIGVVSGDHRFQLFEIDQVDNAELTTNLALNRIEN